MKENGTRKMMPLRNKREIERFEAAEGNTEFIASDETYCTRDIESVVKAAE